MTVPYDIINDIMRVITTISSGHVPTTACDMCNVSYSTFVKYTKPGGLYPQLAEMRSEAEDRLYDLMAEALPHIYDHHIYGVSEPGQASVVSGNIKWLLERRRQRVYGSHTVVEHTITADREVLDALQKAKARAQGVLIDAVVNEVVDIEVIDESYDEEFRKLC